MKATLLSVACVSLLTAHVSAFDLDAFIDQLDEQLRFTAGQDTFRLRLSGTLDLELYHFSQPAPGLISTSAHNLFNPRLTLFADAQAGSSVYFFSQVRIDRGFDPASAGARLGADEYALRITPWRSGVLSIQAGKFATVAGNWVERHLSWDNPFINSPLPYENVTAVSDLEPPAPREKLPRISQKDKYEYLPLIWGPSYATGISVAGAISSFDYALELKNSSLSSRPDVWDLTRRGLSNPAVTSHLAFRPNEGWKLGVSASEGAYLNEVAQPLLPAHRTVGDYRQFVLGQDVSFAWRHWQIWAEAYQVRFEVPRLGDADALSYYIEAKYKITPQLFAAIRWNQEFFAKMDDKTSCGEDTSRIEAAVTYRFTSTTQLKVQYSFQDQLLGHNGHTVATQFTVRF